MVTVVHMLHLMTLILGCGDPPTAWNTEEITQSTCDNREVRLAIGPDDRQHVVFYFDNTSGGRGLMRYTSRLPGGAWDPVVDVAANASHETSLVVDSNNQPFVAYSDGQAETECVRTLQSGLWVDFGTPLASGDFWRGGMGGKLILNAQGAPGLAYFFGPSEDARFSEWNGFAWSTSPVESSGRVGKGMKAALTSSGSPMVAYYHQDENSTHFAERFPSGAWSVVSFPAQDPVDLQAMPNDDALLLRRLGDNGSLVMHVCHAGTWSEDATFPGGMYGYAKAQVDGSGTIHVAATDNAGNVDYLCKSPSGSWLTSPVASGAPVGRAPGLALTEEGSILISFVRMIDRRLVLITGTSVPDVHISLHPRTLKLSSNGNFVTAYITTFNIEEVNEFDPASFIISQINGVPVSPLATAAWNYQDQDGDGILETLMLKFDRGMVASLLSAGPNTVTVSGQSITGEPLAGAGNITAIQ